MSGQLLAISCEQIPLGSERDLFLSAGRLLVHPHQAEDPVRKIDQDKLLYAPIRFGIEICDS